MRRILITAAAMVIAAPAAVALGAQGAAGAAPGYDVYVGYADNLRANPGAFPTPFDTAPGITLLGEPSSSVLDSGAVRIVNTTAVTEVVNHVVVTVGPTTFDLWPQNVSLPPFGTLVLDQTNGENFDTSDAPTISCTPDGFIPQVSVTVNGQPTVYQDTGQVLNTGGVDQASCSNTPNESQQWVSIGAPPCPSGATLTLTPPAQTDTVGSTATVVADFSSCGTPLQGAQVQFAVVNGPNTGTTATSTVDSAGKATLVYSSSLVGTDTVAATVQNAAGSIGSNRAFVTWTPATPSLTTTPPASVPVGGTMPPDVATLSGGVNPTGTIAFGLYGPGDVACQHPLFTSTVAVNGNGSYSSGPAGMVTVPGFYRWYVVYSGDSSNLPAVSQCGVEQTLVTAQVLTGRAYGIALAGLLGVPATPNAGPVATTSSTTVAPPCVVRLAGLNLVANSLCASVVTSAPYPSHSTAKASVASATVSGILGVPTIVIGAVQSSSTTSCAGSSGSTTIASLKVGNTVILASPSPVRPNTTVNVGILKIVLNEQIPITGAEGGLTVNAIHITGLNNAINLVVASSESDIRGCP